MKTRLVTVNFGLTKASLSTVGYTLYTSTGATSQARATTGVIEVGTATGIYAAPISMAEGFDGIILWDTGDASVRYGVQETLSQLNSIQDETDHIRLIWNSLRNQGAMYETILNKLGGLKATPAGKDYEKLLLEIRALVKGLPVPTLAEIRQALTVKVDAPRIPAPVINIPKVVIPDYHAALAQLKAGVEGIMVPDHSQALSAILQSVNAGLARLLDEVKLIPKAQKDYTEELRLLSAQLRAAERVLQSRVDAAAKPADVSRATAAALAAIEGLQRTLTQAIQSTEGVDRLLDRLEHLRNGKKNQDILAMLGYG